MPDLSPTAEPHREPGPVAPHGPHSTPDAPQDAATPERGADGRTVVRLDQIPDETLHAAIRTMARVDPRGFRALVARAGWTTGDGPDTPADSQDSTDTPPGHDPLTSADTVRTGQDAAATIQRQLKQIVNLRATVLQRDSTIARIRRLANDWAILRTHGSAAYELRDTLDESDAEQPDVVHPGGEQQVSEAQQVDEPHPAEAAADHLRNGTAAHIIRTTAPDSTADTETDGCMTSMDAVRAAPDDELTAEEARALVDDLDLQLYRAEDALAFVAECCTIAERENRTITTANVREWLKGARCGRQRLADRPAPDDALREQYAAAIERVRAEHQPDGGHCGICADPDGSAACWPCPTIRALDGTEQPTT